MFISSVCNAIILIYMEFNSSNCIESLYQPYAVPVLWPTVLFSVVCQKSGRLVKMRICVNVCYTVIYEAAVNISYSDFSQRLISVGQYIYNLSYLTFDNNMVTD